MVNLNSPAARPRKFLSLPSLHTLRRHRLKVLHSYFTKVIHEYFERRDSLVSTMSNHLDERRISGMRTLRAFVQSRSCLAGWNQDLYKFFFKPDIYQPILKSGGNNIIISGTTDGGTFNFGPSEKKEIAWSVG
ncbi:unnamed protein product [Rhizophagus irregularis]|nr:unnamed protein product [Rhizophagus irregularis]CAB5377927.1 unnamed protein product [Rhizophagus irregularis]